MLRARGRHSVHVSVVSYTHNRRRLQRATAVLTAAAARDSQGATSLIRALMCVIRAATATTDMTAATPPLGERTIRPGHMTGASPRSYAVAIIDRQPQMS